MGRRVGIGFLCLRCHHEIHRVNYLKVVPKLILNCCMSPSCTEFSMEEVNLKPRVPTKAVCAEHLELRREILTWLNLQKQALNRAGGKSGKKGAEAALIGPHASRNSFESNSFSKLDKLNQASGDYNAKLGVTILEDLELSKNSKKLAINAYEKILDTRTLT